MAKEAKRVLITGASSGIGRATALHLAKKGWRVFAAVRKDIDAREIEAAGAGRLETVRLDVTDDSSIAAAVAQVKSRLQGQGLDGLFNNAGIGILSSVEHTSLDTLRHVYAVNVFGQISAIQAFLPLVRLARGRIINTGSVGDHLAPPYAGALASSKAAFASLSAALRLELRPQGIYVCVIEPGSINTPAIKKTVGEVAQTIAAMPSEGRELYGESLRRMANVFAKNEHAGSSPESVAKVVERALTDRRPKTRYPAGKDAAKLTLLARFLPERLLDLALLKTFGL